MCPTKNGAFQIKEAYVCEGVPPYTAILGRQALDEMRAIIDFAVGEVTVRSPFTDPGALECAMQAQCGDGATPEEIAEMQSKLEWFTHFSARQLNKPLVLHGATRTQIRSVMATMRVETRVLESTVGALESTDVCDGPVLTMSQGDCLPEEEHSQAAVEAMLDFEAITKEATNSARLEEEELRVATLLMAEFGWDALTERQSQLMVCMIERGTPDRPTHHVTETP